MFSAKNLLALPSLLPLISATPFTSSRRQALTCGAVLEPSIIQFINESSPSTVYPNNYYEGGQVTAFQNVKSASSGVIPMDRVYTVLAFTDIPSTAYGCQLSVYLPPNYPISTIPSGSPIPPIDVHTFGMNQLGNDAFSNTWDWDTLSELYNPPSTLFGTVTLEDGVQEVVNSVECPFEASGGASNALAFSLEIAEGVDVEAGVGYNWFTTDPNGVGLVGFLLTYDC